MPPAPDSGEISARSKFSCPACGAEATWSPARQALVCAFCGTESPASREPTTGAVVERDLVTALQSVDRDHRGWAAPKVSVRCRSCEAVSVFDPDRVAQNCEFCGSAQLVPYEEAGDVFRPESVLPFRVPETQARDRLRAWFAKVWFAPNALRRRALADTVRGLYLPYWTFDAQVDADWSAEAGHYYYTTESYREGGALRTRQVRHVRWEPASGRVSHFFDDDLVCASVGLHPGLLRGIEPFPTRELQPYDAGYVAGWVVERYQVDLAGAAERAREAMEAKTRALCAAQIPGDTHRNLVVRSRYAAQTFKHILAPVWLLTYVYGDRAYQVAINGSTGTVAGEYPKSWIKMALAALAGLVALWVFLYFGGSLQ
jgi:hypothetical protein